MLNYRDILINGVALPRRAKMNFAGLTGADNPGEKRTDLFAASLLTLSASNYTASANVSAGTLAKFDVVGTATATLLPGQYAGQRIGVWSSGTSGNITIATGNDSVILSSTGAMQAIFFWVPAVGENAAKWWIESKSARS